LTVRAEESGDRVGAYLLDTKEARSIFEKMKADGSEDLDAFEDKVFVVALMKTAGPFLATSERGWEETLETIFLQELKPKLVEAKHWSPYGVLELDSGRVDAEIQLDGASIGSTEGKPTRIVGVANGTRTLALIHPGVAPYSTKVEVVPDGVARVAHDFEAR